MGSCVHSKGQWVAGTEMLLRFQSCEKKQKHQNIISGQALMNSSSFFPSPWQQANAAWPAWIQGTAASTGTVQGCADAERDSGTDGHAPAGSASHAGAGKEREGTPTAEEGAAEKVIPRDSKGTPLVFPASNPVSHSGVVLCNGAILDNFVAPCSPELQNTGWKERYFSPAPFWRLCYANKGSLNAHSTSCPAREGSRCTCAPQYGIFLSALNFPFSTFRMIKKPDFVS